MAWERRGGRWPRLSSLSCGQPPGAGLGLLGAIFFTLLWRVSRLNTALPLKSRALTFCDYPFPPWRHIISSIVSRLEGEYVEFEFACALCRRYKQSHSVEKCKEKKQIFGFNPFQTQTPGVGLTVLYPTWVSCFLSWIFVNCVFQS